MAPTLQASTIIPITFPADGLLLKGTLHRPPEANGAPVVIGCHGLFSTGDSPKQVALAERLNGLGIAFFRFDHRGCGRSEGAFGAVTSLAGRCADLRAAVALMEKRPELDGRIGLFGSSMGGAVSLAVAREIDPASIVTLAAPVRMETADHAVSAIRRSEASTGLGGLFFRENLPFDISEGLGRIRNLLVIHGEKDEVIPVDHAREIHGSAGRPKRLLIQAGGDHRVSDPDHQAAFMAAAVAWFETGLPTGGHP